MNGLANTEKEFDSLAPPARPHVVIQIACNPPHETVTEKIRDDVANKVRKACQNWRPEGWVIGGNDLRIGDKRELILSATALPPHNCAFNTELFKKLFQGFGKVAADLEPQCNLKVSVSLDGMIGVSLAQDRNRVCDLARFDLEPIDICGYTAYDDVRPPRHEVTTVRDRKEVLAKNLEVGSCQAARDIEAQFRYRALALE